ncbi:MULTISPECIES: hypothetical protein [unclassified Pseudoxanthomonas]|uniref:hypothetical protein n=1 Tax=unclassified Pseudoxanthomonas TaxID=2645906 RepID=UPI0030773502
MSYLVFCTFDLKNASSQDYKDAYADLGQIGLTKVQKSDKGGDVVIPTTSAMGTFNGSSSGEVRDYVRDKVKSAFAARKFKSEIFVAVGQSWAWGAAST